MNDFDNLLERQRKHLDLSLNQAAKQIGCTKPHLHDIEKGKSRNPRASILNGFVKTYSLSVECWEMMVTRIEKAGFNRRLFCV